MIGVFFLLLILRVSDAIYVPSGGKHQVFFSIRKIFDINIVKLWLLVEKMSLLGLQIIGIAFVFCGVINILKVSMEIFLCIIYFVVKRLSQ